MHTGTHAPAVQTSVAAHARPHEPQFCSSVCVSTHAAAAPVPQRFVPIAQRQAPAVQVAPVGQRVPHAPQLVASVRGSMHALPHMSRGGMHVDTVMHMPPMHA